MQLFNVNDIVFLISGSPPLVVTEVKEEEITCTWIDDDLVRQVDSFHPACLVEGLSVVIDNVTS